MATPEDEVAAAQKLLGSTNVDPASQQLFGIETEAGAGRALGGWANDQYDAFAGHWIPTNMDESQWAAAVTAVDTYAKNTDYRAVPSWSHVVDMYENQQTLGIDFNDPRTVAKYLSQYLPPDQAAKMPWASTGLSQAQFSGAGGMIDQWKGQFESLIGASATEQLFSDPNTTDAVARTLAAGYDMTTAFNILKQTNADYKTGGKYGYVASGYTYDTFQQYKNNPSTRQGVIARFGAGAVNSDEAYMEQLVATPPPPGAGQSTSVQSQSQRTAANIQGRSSIR